MGFTSSRKTIKLLSILDLNDVPLSCGETIKEHLLSAGGVSAGSGCSAGRVCVLGHRRQGFYHWDAHSRHFRPHPITAAQPRQQPHHGGQGNRHPDAHCSQTGTETYHTVQGREIIYNNVHQLHPVREISMLVSAAKQAKQLFRLS